MKILLVMLLTLTLTLHAKVMNNLPFVGKGFYNVDGGSGTNESIIIKNNGDTIITLHGMFSSGITYKGKFTNPIIFDKNRKYLFIKHGVCSIVNGKFENCTTIELERGNSKFNSNFFMDTPNINLISFIKNQHFDYCPNENIGTVLDNFFDTNWKMKKQNNHTVVTVKGQVAFMNIPQNIEFIFSPDIFNNQFSLQQLLLNGKKEEFLTSALIDTLCRYSHGEEDLNQELGAVKNLKGENIEKYLLKYSDEQKYSNKERIKYYAKYINHIVTMSMEIFSIEKEDTNLYRVQGTIARGNNSVSIFMRVYTQNKKEALFLRNYKTGINSDLFETQKKVLFKGKFKINNDDLFGVSCYMAPAIMVLK